RRPAFAPRGNEFGLDRRFDWHAGLGLDQLQAAPFERALDFGRILCRRGRLGRALAHDRPGLGLAAGLVLGFACDRPGLGLVKGHRRFALGLARLGLGVAGSRQLGGVNRPLEITDCLRSDRRSRRIDRRVAGLTRTALAAARLLPAHAALAAVTSAAAATASAALAALTLSVLALAVVAGPDAVRCGLALAFGLGLPGLLGLSLSRLAALGTLEVSRRTLLSQRPLGALLPVSFLAGRAIGSSVAPLLAAGPLLGPAFAAVPEAVAVAAIAAIAPIAPVAIVLGPRLA